MGAGRHGRQPSNAAYGGGHLPELRARGCGGKPGAEVLVGALELEVEGVQDNEAGTETETDFGLKKKRR